MTIGREFDGRGNRVKLTYPNDRVVSYEPDALNRIDFVYDGVIPPTPLDTMKFASYSYSGPGRLKERIYNNGTKLSVGYDSLKRVTDFHHVKMGIPDTTVARFQYDHDLMGNRQHEKRIHQNKMDIYSYDSVYRLTDFTRDANLDLSGGTLTHYELDGVGNRDWTQEGSNPVIDYTSNSLNQYTSVGEISRGYDANGNMTDDGEAWKLYFDYKDRLVRVEDKATSQTVAQYWYDCFGRRIEKSVAGMPAMFYYEGASVIEERDGVGGTSRQFVYGAGVDEVLVMIDGLGEKYYYHTNSLGTVTHVTNWSGVLTEEYRYDAFGLPTIYDDQGQVIPESAIDNPYMFTGRRYDKETGFYYYRARYYDPLIGRFLHRDPKGYVDSMGLYNYAGNNPVNMLDPFGIQEEQKTPEKPQPKQDKEEDLKKESGPSEAAKAKEKSSEKKTTEVTLSEDKTASVTKAAYPTEYKNVEKAIELIKLVGEYNEEDKEEYQKKAKELGDLLTKGKIHVGNLIGKKGLQRDDKIILDLDVANPRWRRKHSSDPKRKKEGETPLDPKAKEGGSEFGYLVGIAGTLIHEQIHLHQGSMTLTEFLLEGTRLREITAHAAEIAFQLQTWIMVYQLDGLVPKYWRATALYCIYGYMLGATHDLHKEYGGPDLEWLPQELFKLQPSLESPDVVKEGKSEKPK